ncbi:histone-fold-containing protein [Kalaharituber pfeilii]|nr:histone-fold-containing protein [Kalaharituber pfeilii]
MDSQFPAGGPSRHDQSHQQQQPPAYDITVGGHYGASAALSSSLPSPQLYGGAFANVSQGLHGHYRDILTTYWQQIITQLENEDHDYKVHQLPLARIKKVMKADPEVKMISAEAPILFAKGCDIFITELTIRAWIHAEENKRRTLQRSDIASALAKSDMFDFLIDIVPREEATHAKRSTHQSSHAGPSQHPQQAQQQQPQQQAPPPPQQAVPQHQAQMPPGADYTSISRGITQQESEAYQQQQMYGGAVPGGPPGPYPQHQQLYGEIGDMYYPQMSQAHMYHVNQQRHLQGQGDPGSPNDPAHPFARNDPGEGDADAEGERDYEVS